MYQLSNYFFAHFNLEMFSLFQSQEHSEEFVQASRWYKVTIYVMNFYLLLYTSVIIHSERWIVLVMRQIFYHIKCQYINSFNGSSRYKRVVCFWYINPINYTSITDGVFSQLINDFMNWWLHVNLFKGGSRHKVQHYNESVLFFIRHFSTFLHRNALAAWAACLDPPLTSLPTL